MKRWLGVAIFGIFAAFAYYVHFSKVSRIYARWERKMPVERGIAAVDGELCHEVAAHQNRFARVRLKVKKQNKKGKTLELVGKCLTVRLHISKIWDNKTAKCVEAEGFIKRGEEGYYMDVWDREAISLCEAP